jgi:hypothetical protein
MITELLKKWFGLPLVPACTSCDILRDQLEKSEVERRELLHKLLDRGVAEPAPSLVSEELRPITPQFIPWRVKQQMLEQEDRRAAQLMRDKQKEIKEITQLEQELGVE